jgi:branched-chain amino acid transport system substrate-binding protein
MPYSKSAWMFSSAPRTWIQPMRFAMQSVRLDYNSIVGHIAWEGKPVKNVAKTPLVGGQWVPGYKFTHWIAGQKFKNDLMIVNNASDASIETQWKLEPLP